MITPRDFFAIGFRRFDRHQSQLACRRFAFGADHFGGFVCHSTAAVTGVVFGPIMLWFATLAVLGIRGILFHPAILHSLNPYYALVFITHHG